jgi:hypothetical protein
LKEYTIEKLWLVPSLELVTGTNLLCSTTTGKKKYRFSASVTPGTNARWSAFCIEPKKLGDKILEIINSHYKKTIVVENKTILLE